MSAYYFSFKEESTWYQHNPYTWKLFSLGLAIANSAEQGQARILLKGIENVFFIFLFLFPYNNHLPITESWFLPKSDRSQFPNKSALLLRIDNRKIFYVNVL